MHREFEGSIVNESCKHCSDNDVNKEVK